MSAGRGVEVVMRGSGHRPQVAFTFDDGPSPWTAAIAASFERHECHATFFVRGAAVRERPDTIAALTAAGHEVGNHLWSHRKCGPLSRAELREEVERTADAIEAAGAPRPTLVRSPYFSAPQSVTEAAAGTSAKIFVLRSVGVPDWDARFPEEVFTPVLERIKAGDIVCLHDGVSPNRQTDSRQPTADAVAVMVPQLIDRGLQLVTVSELLE